MKTQENNNTETILRRITPAQAELLDFVRHVEAPDIVLSFSKALETAIFGVDGYDKSEMFMAYQLCRVLKGIKREGTPVFSKQP